MQFCLASSLFEQLRDPSSFGFFGSLGALLRLAGTSAGPRQRGYFKFLSPWLAHPNFERLVLHSWVDSDPWSANLHRLTSNLKEWNQYVFGNIFKRKHMIIKRLEGIGCQLLVADNSCLVALRDMLWEEYQLLTHQEEAYWYHQAKVKWVSLGDRNTQFFYQATLARRRRNRITALMDYEGR